MSKIILLNGAGSSGKTSISRSIQHLSTESWLTFGIDTFIEMKPSQAKGKTCEYFSFISGKNTRGPTMKAESQSSGNKLFGVMADFASLLANQGNNIIIDEVLFDDNHLKSYIEKLSQHIVYFICVTCDLEIMQEREFLRRDREIGSSNEQFNRIHKGIREYDFLRRDREIGSSNEQFNRIHKGIREYDFLR